MGTIGALVLAALVLPGLESARAAITTDPTPDVTGSNTRVTLADNIIPENGVLQSGGTASIASSVLLNPGFGDREIRTSYDADTVYVSGSVEAPEGWLLQYSTDNGASWVTTEPVPASGVTDIRATKSGVAAGLVTGYSQEYSSETVSSIPSSTFDASSGGDGWGVELYENYVLNIYHHTTTTQLECKLKDTGESCAPGNGIYTITSPSGGHYFAAQRSDLAVDPANGVAYVMTAQTNDASGGTKYKPGALCIDLKPLPNGAPTWCGFTPVSETLGSSYWDDWSDVTKVGTRYYSLITPNNPQLICFDSSTGASCADTPISIPTASLELRTKVFGNQLFIKTNTKTYCLLASAPATTCSGWEGGKSHSSDTASDIAFHADSNRDIDGLCIRTGCWDFAGNSQPLWANPFSQSVFPTSYHKVNRGVTTLGRYYSPKWSNFDVYCFDFVTGSMCKDSTGTSDFVGLTTSNWYMVEVDPENPACLWVNSDGRKIANFDAWTGAAGCSSNPVITLQPTQFAPRYSCSTTNGIDQWSTLKIDNLVGSDGTTASAGTAESIVLTVRDGQGYTVSGWSNKLVVAGVPLDMTGLNTLDSGSRPTFSFAFQNVTGTIASATISLEYRGKGPEICSDVTIATPSEGLTTAITINSYLVDSVAPAGTYQSQRNFVIDPAAQETTASQSVPSAPFGLRGTGLNTTATITFTPPSNDGGLAISGYRYSLDGGASYVNLADPVDNGDGTASFAVEGLTAGTTYSVVIAAKNSLGWGPNSSALSLTAQLVNLSTLGDSYLSVGTINLVTQNENSLPYTYTAEPSSVCTVSGTTLTLVAVGACSVTQDQAGDANNLATTASKSFSVLADPVTLTAPGAPQNLAASPGSTQVTLSWAAPALDGGAAVSDYIVQYKVGSSWVPFTDGVNTLTSVVITGLSNGTSYDFKVAAVNSVGQGLFTTAVTSTPATIAGAATNLAGSKTNPSTSASLSWTAPASTGGTLITDYKVSYKLTSDPTWTLFDDGVSTSTSATITGLEENSDYDYQVEVVNAAGTSAAVSTVTLVATEGDSQVGLTWTAPNTGGATILNYVVEYREAGETSWLTFDTQGASTSATLSSLTNGQAYDVRVAAMVSDGSSGQVASSYTSTVRATPFSAPAAPALVAQPGVSQLTISWTAPTANGAAITDYIIEYKLNADSSWTVLSDGTSALTFAVITNLTNGSLYDVRAKSVNVAGQSAYSEIAQAIPRTVPGAVTGLTLTGGNGSLTLSWTAPTNNGGAEITDYQIQYKLITSTTWIIFQRSASTETTISVPNLDGLTRYSARVAAVNPAGVGSFGPASSEVTLEKLEPVVTPSTPSTPTEPTSNEIQLDIKPVQPGQKPLDNAVKVSAGGNLEIKGSNLSLVTKVMVGDTETGFKNTGSAIEIILPAKLSLMAYETKIMTSDGTVTDGPVVDVTEVTAVIGGQDALLRRLPNGEIKVWVFDPLQTGKIQYFLKGREIAWVRPDEDDPDAKLRVQADTGTQYLVRTLRISENEIADFELRLDGVRVEVFSIEGRASSSIAD